MTFVTLSAELIGIRESLAFYLVAIINATSAVGRVGGGLLAVRYGPINVMALGTVPAALFTYLWPYTTSQGAFIAVVSLYGCVPPTCARACADADAAQVLRRAVHRAVCGARPADGIGPRHGPTHGHADDNHGAWCVTPRANRVHLEADDVQALWLDRRSPAPSCSRRTTSRPPGYLQVRLRGCAPLIP